MFVGNTFNQKYAKHWISAASLKNYYLDPKHFAQARERNRKQWEEEKHITESATNIVTNLYIIKYSRETKSCN